MPDERDPNERPPILSAESQALLANVVKDPVLGKEFLRLLKKGNPNAPIPVVELEDRIAEIQSAADKKVGELAQTVQTLRTELGIKEKRGFLATKGLDEKQIAEVEKLMVDEQIPNYESALKVYRYNQQLASPTPQIPQRKPVTEGMPESVIKGDTAALTQHARRVAYEAVNEIKQAHANQR